MNRILFFTITLALAIEPCFAQVKSTTKPKPPITAQATRGREQFLHSAKGTACATCHLVDGQGTAVGPDLTDIGSVVGPHGLVGTIKMSMTAYVQEVQTKTNGTFPGIQKQKDGDTLQIWDLSLTPPVLRTLQSSDVTSMKQNDKWKHPPTGAGYTQQELADIIAYLKWAATGSITEVKPSDL
jgi:putative heme-binding domain-containing protein